MPDGITHSNKDVLFKALSRCYENKSLAVYGLNIPKIKVLLPTNYPSVTATEIHAENAFLLEDGSLLILEYESDPRQDDFLKYNLYVINTLRRLHKDGTNVNKVIIAVIYTGDIKTSAFEFDVGALRIQVEQVFLSAFDTEGMYADIKSKIDSGKELVDDDVMRLIILPLTQSDKTHKQKIIESAIDLAKQVRDEQQQLFIIAGILTASDKFISRQYSKQVKEWIKLTQVARLFEEEKVEAVNEAVNEKEKAMRRQLAAEMLSNDEDIVKIMMYTKFSRAEIDEMRMSVGA